MLWAAGVKRADRLAVHGHLTVNGEKMSKSRGTFVTGKTYLESGLDPELLRYFYAANLGPGIYDIDLSLEEFRNRVNADLAKRIANLASRVHALVVKADPDGVGPEEIFSARDLVAEKLSVARDAYQALEYRVAIREANAIADVFNKHLQDWKPWEDLSSHRSRALLHEAGKALHAIAVILAPVMPRFAGQLAESLGGAGLAWPAGFTPTTARRSASPRSRPPSPRSTPSRWRSSSSPHQPRSRRRWPRR